MRLHITEGPYLIITYYYKGFILIRHLEIRNDFAVSQLLGVCYEEKKMPNLTTTSILPSVSLSMTYSKRLNGLSDFYEVCCRCL